MRETQRSPHEVFLCLTIHKLKPTGLSQCRGGFKRWVRGGHGERGFHSALSANSAFNWFSLELTAARPFFRALSRNKGRSTIREVLLSCALSPMIGEAAFFN